MPKLNVIKIILMTLLMVVFQGCGSTTTDSNNSYPSQVKNILFAHGFLSSSETWDHYSEVTSNYSDREWVVYRTNVSMTGTIAQRASQLADYINAQNVEEDSLLVVGHSMGGLDLRYIISEGNQNQVDTNKYYSAAKKIHQFYTIATPHKGSNIAGLVPTDNGAIYDLSSTQMDQFNEDHPYAHSSIDNRAIEMLAFRFTCDLLNSGDGVVKVSSQILDGAPYIKEAISGKHTTGNYFVCKDGVVAELLQDSIINSILDDNTPEQVTNNI